MPTCAWAPRASPRGRRRRGTEPATATETAAAAERRARRRLAGFYFVYFALLGSYAPYFGLYLQDLGFSAWRIGVLLSVVPLVRIVTPVLWATLAERGERHRTVLRATSVVAVLCATLLSLARGFDQVLAAFLLLNLVWCASLPLVESATLARLRKAPGDYGRIRVWGSVSFVLAVVCMGAVVERAGPAVLAPVLAALFAANALAAWAVPFERAAGHGHEGGSWGRALRRRPVQALLAGCFLMAVAHGPYYTFFTIHLVGLGYAKSEAGLLWGLAVAAEVCVFMWLPQLMRRVPLRALLASSFALAALRFALVAALARHAWVMALAQCLHAATFGVHHAAALAAIHEAFDGPHRARGQALYSGVGFGAGGAVGGLVSGVLWDAAGPAVTFAMAAATALAGWAVILLWFAPARPGPARAGRPVP